MLNNHTPRGAAFVLALTLTPAFGQIALEQLDLTKVRGLAPPMGYPAQAAKSVAGKTMSINGTAYEHGVGTHSGSRMDIDLGGGATRFTAMAGIDDAAMPLPKPLPGS